MMNTWFDTEELINVTLINSETLEVGEDGWLKDFVNTNPIDIVIIDSIINT